MADNEENTPKLRGAEEQPIEDDPTPTPTPDPEPEPEPVYVTGTIVYYDSLHNTSTSSSGSYEVGSTFSDSAPAWANYTVSPSSYSFTVTGPFSVTYTYTRISVWCTQNIYYDGTRVSYAVDGPLYAGYTYTPEAHIPSYDSTHYDFSYCSPSGAMTCPTSNFSVDYYFVKTRVDGYVVLYYDDVSQGVVDSDIFTIGQTYRVSTYMPSYDSTQYKYDHAEINGVILGTTFTAPSTNFYIDYFFVHKCQPYIYATKNGVTKWWPATVYIYKNSTDKWVEAQPHIYDNGEWS